MTEEQQTEQRSFLSLGSVVILKGSVKKLLIASRGSIFEDRFYDYGAFMYPEGIIDTNIVYFNRDDILKIVFEGYSDEDNELVIDILNDAYAQFQQQQGSEVAPATAVAPTIMNDDDPFASVRDLEDDDE